MKRETLKELGLADDVIDTIMAENGKDIEKHKAEAETLKTTGEQMSAQLAEANKTIEDFKSMDVDGIKQSADEYKEKFEQAQQDFDAQVAKMAYDSAAEKFVDGLKPKDGLSKKAILSEFTGKEFKLDGDTFQGADTWAEQFKKENASHFADTPPAPGIFSGKIGGGLKSEPPGSVADLKSALTEHYNK